MNKTKIEYVDYTWNPVTGCLHDCKYCYARRIANRFKGWTDSDGSPHTDTIFKNQPRELSEPLYKAVEDKVGKWPKAPYPYGFKPTFYKYRLDEPKKLKKPSRILVVSMGDLFGGFIPDEWINQILEVVKECSQHTFLFLTKNPNRYYSFKFPNNAWVGASAVNRSDEKVIQMGKGFIVTNAHTIADTMSFFDRSFLSIEPLLNDVSQDIDISFIDWVIVGAQTGPGAIKPKEEWIQNLVDMAREYKVPIFLKDNLNWSEKIQEYPSFNKEKDR